MQNLIPLLKKNAPVIYQMHAAKRTNQLSSKLITLRQKYKDTKDAKEKKEIQEEAQLIKNELELYNP